MANELPVKLQLLKKYTEIFNDQSLYFSSNLPQKSMGDFNIGMQGHDKFTIILHEIKCRRSEFAPSNHSILNKVDRYNIESIDHTKLELPSQIKKLCYDFSHLKNEEFEKACLDLENHNRLGKLIQDDVLLIYRDFMEFDEMVDLLIRCELDPNIQPLLDHHLTLLS
jgi:hypothetical protein